MSVISGLGLAVLAAALRLLQLLTNLVLRLVYRKPGWTVPTLKYSILIESATSLAAKIRNRKLTSQEVVKTFIRRIEEVNPIVHAVVDNRFEDAMAEAARVDDLIASGTKSKEELEAETPLLGVPFTTKDCMAVKGLLHTAGVYARKDKRAEADSEVVALLRKAGAIPLALTNVPELCMWWESNNTIHGRTRNPYDTNRIAGGSSGGEGSLLASAGSPFGIGSDIGGSIRIPSYMNGIFGHKGSSGTAPLGGHHPEAADIQMPYQSIGPMSRYATDLTTIFKLISVNSKVDLRLDEKVDVSKLKYYYMDDNGGNPFESPVDPNIKKAIGKVVDHFKKTHGITVERVNLTKLKQSWAIFLAKFTTKEGPQMAEALLDFDGKLNLYGELVKLAMGLSKHTLPGLVFAISETLQPAYDSPHHKKYVEFAALLRKEFEDLLGTNGVFFYPTHPTPPLYHTETLIRPFNISYTAIFNVLGLPATACPLGLGPSGFPLGLQVVAGPHQDRLTLAVAVELEKAFGGWVPPPTHGNATFKVGM